MKNISRDLESCWAKSSRHLPVPSFSVEMPEKIGPTGRTRHCPRENERKLLAHPVGCSVAIV